MIRKCHCKHEFQDKVYGAGMRVHNQGNKEARCTVCGAKVEMAAPKKEDKK